MASRGTQPSGLGRAVRQLRLERDLSQERLANLSGVTTQVIGGIERGTTTNPHWLTVTAIAAALEVSTAELAALAEKLDR